MHRLIDFTLCLYILLCLKNILRPTFKTKQKSSTFPTTEVRDEGG
jgi:hypothetical protein